VTTALFRGRLQQPSISCGPRTHHSPASPTAHSPAARVRIETSLDRDGKPMLPLKVFRSNGLTRTAGEHSVKP
jgi:hypothetical protein